MFTAPTFRPSSSLMLASTLTVITKSKLVARFMSRRCEDVHIADVKDNEVEGIHADTGKAR